MRRLSLSLIIVVLGSTLGLGWLLNQIYVSHNEENKNEQEIIFSEWGKNLANLLAESNDRHAIVQAWNKNNNSKLELIDDEFFPVPESHRAAFYQGEPLILESEDGLAVYYILQTTNASVPQEVFAFHIEQSPETEKGRKLEWMLTLSFYLGLVLIILIWIWPLINQLARLQKIAVLFGEGDLQARVVIPKYSYIRDIQNEFNHMAERIAQLVADNKLLSRAVSHDLKTPLSRLRFGVDALVESEREDQRQRYAERISRDLDEMQSLVDILLQYARMDEERVRLNKEVVSLKSLCESILESQVVDENISVDFDCEATLVDIEADRTWLAMMINNLVGNALNHAKSKIKIRLTNTPTELCLSIEDDGPGIPKEQRQQAFLPFWRGKQSREQGGHGMGLAIAARIAEWHHATLSIEDSTLGGAKLAFYVPFSP